MTLPAPPAAAAGHPAVLQWLAPAPLWNTAPVGAAASGLAQPFLAEFATDSFADVFLGMLNGSAGTPSDLGGLVPDTTVDGTPAGAYRLFQPLSERYYLVTAELVCRRPGIPDHTVNPRAGEKATFVMRRQDPATGGEQAFVPDAGGGTWAATSPTELTPGEKQYPMNQAPVAPFADAGTTAAGLGLARDGGAGRTLWWGYVPVAVRNDLVRPMADPAQQLADMQDNTPGVPDPRLDALAAKVVSTWAMLDGHQDAGGNKVGIPRNPEYGGLFVLLDLGDWIREHLPVVYDHLVHGTTLTSGSAYDALVQAMNGLKFTQTGNITISLAQAVKDTIPFASLVTGQDIAGPTVGYQLRNIKGGNLSTWLGDRSVNGSLARYAEQALAVDPKPAALPPELEGMIREDAGQPTTIGQGPTYVIRTVFEHPPCRPVLSAPTHPFELARALDADAPARKVLLQMPDITNLRSFKRGVAIETPAALQKVLNAVTPDVLKGDSMGDPGSGLQLGFICSFSLQIIFLVAFIVMFIFLILLNIVFFWLPFLKICFPIPVPAKSPQGPTP
jgi:hypothetical protein